MSDANTQKSEIAPKTMNIFEISEKIAQRPPFQMIEKVTELVPNVTATGIKNVSVNEPYFMGHFPGTPIMPGVLVVEACAQLCSLVIEKSPEDLDDKLYVLLKIDGFKLVKPALGYPCNLRCEALNMILLLLEQALRNKHRKVDIFNARLLKPVIKLPLD